MTKAKLKPCPFCGGEATIEPPYRNVAICLQCSSRGPLHNLPDNNAIAEWNHRPTEQALVEALKMWKARIVGPTDHTMQDVLNATDHALEMAGAVE